MLLTRSSMCLVLTGPNYARFVTSPDKQLSLGSLEWSGVRSSLGWLDYQYDSGPSANTGGVWDCYVFQK
jgi:hypothetical protein